MTDPTSLRLLLVEDNPADARLVHLLLEDGTQRTFELVHKSYLEAALEALVTAGTATASESEGISDAATAEQASHGFDVVLLDLSLPDSFGMDTVKRVLEAAPRLPIVVLTGLEDPEVGLEAIRAGAQDYLIKGVGEGDLLWRAITYAIERKRNQLLIEELSHRNDQFNDRIRQELAFAREMQFDLLPKQDHLQEVGKRYGIAITAHFETSSELGGDFWQLFELDDTRLGLVMADFSGHGVASAINTFRLHTIIQRIPPNGYKPADWLEALNKEMHGLLPVGHFATMLYGVLDRPAGQFVYAGAAAPSPIFVNGTGFRLLDASGVPLGISGHATYDSHEVSFSPGSALFLYSDAFTDCPDTEGVFPGEDGLLSRLEEAAEQQGYEPPEALLKNVMGWVQRPLPDDLTALWIRAA